MLSKIASLCMILAGIGHLGALGISGFSETPVLHFGAAIVLLLVGYGVFRSNSRLLNWISFLVLPILSIITIGQISEWNVVPAVVFYGIAALEWVAILALFLVLWMRKPMVATA